MASDASVGVAGELRSTAGKFDRLQARLTVAVPPGAGTGRPALCLPGRHQGGTVSGVQTLRRSSGGYRASPRAASLGVVVANNGYEDLAVSFELHVAKGSGSWRLLGASAPTGGPCTLVNKRRLLPDGTMRFPVYWTANRDEPDNDFPEITGCGFADVQVEEGNQHRVTVTLGTGQPLSRAAPVPPGRRCPATTSSSGAPAATATATAVLAECGVSFYGLVAKPKEWDNGCTGGSPKFSRLVWSDWGSARATARGLVALRVCDPDCVNSYYRTTGATLQAYGLAPCNGKRLYTKVRYSLEGRSFVLENRCTT